MMHPAVEYWDRGVAQVPQITGAAKYLDGRDMPEIAQALGLTLPLSHVLDVGCGTGRIAPFCDGYLGVDIAPSAVTYCQQQGRNAQVIDGPADLPMNDRGVGFDWILCFSVFTHIDRAERLAYLKAFYATGAQSVIVDIIPGKEAGGVARWTADATVFQHDLAEAGWRLKGTTERVDPAGQVSRHRYYYVERDR